MMSRVLVKKNEQDLLYKLAELVEYSQNTIASQNETIRRTIL